MEYINNGGSLQCGLAKRNGKPKHVTYKLTAVYNGAAFTVYKR